MSSRAKYLNVVFFFSFVFLLIGLAVIAIAEPIAFNKASAAYAQGQWGWYNEYRSFIYETTSANIKTIGIILSIIAASGVIMIPIASYRNRSKE
jgi:hypothetical protein